jgi:hypothetical protein
MYDTDAPETDTEELLEDGLVALLRGYADDAEELLEAVASVNTFRNEGVLTSNRGLVVTMEDGSEYQVSLVLSRRARG